MTPAEKITLTRIHDLLAAGDKGTAVTEMLKDARFCAVLKANPQKVPASVEARLNALPFLFLMAWLYRRDYVGAATLIWGPDVFTAEPQAVRDIWTAVGENNLINVLGCGSAGKTYSAAARFVLEWVLDPDWTLVRVMSVKEEHVIRNLFADMQRLYAGSVIQLPGKADSGSIATPQGKLTGQGIFPIVIPRGPEASGTIKGSKVKPRPKHPLFGTSSRTFLIIDEAQEVPESAWMEVPNLFSSIDEGDTEHTVILAAANPKNIFSRFGQNCVRAVDWDEISKRISKIRTWVSDRGWFCIRINALETENVVNGKTLYPRFITAHGVNMKIKDVGGDMDHPLIWSEVMGMFPPNGVMVNIIQKHWVDRAKKEWLFESETQPVAGEDVGLTGDPPALTAGRIGRAVAYTDYAGVRHNLPHPRWAIQIDSVGLLPLTGDTQILADETMARLRPLGVKPNLFGIDRTGVGQGTSDNLRHQWDDKVNGIKGSTRVVDICAVHYSEKASETRVCEEDSKSCYELYDGVIGEMWYATARFFEFDCIAIGKGVEDQVIAELVNRRGGSPAGKGKLRTVESKDDYKARNGGKSPDRADSFTLCIHTARHAVAELKPKAPDTTVEIPKRPSLFDKESTQGLKFVNALDMGWQRLSMGKEMNVSID